MFFDLTAACASFIGVARDNNEDNFLFDNKHLEVFNKGLKKTIGAELRTRSEPLFAVFDGLGGEKYGEEASFLAAKSFQEKIETSKDIAISGKEFFIKACNNANENLCRLSAERNNTSLGSTIAALRFSQNEVYACNIGDSKIFRIREQQLVQISEDHTDEKILKSIGSEKKPSLLQYLGIPKSEMKIEPFITKGDIQQDDIYIICSDGVTDVITSEELYEFSRGSEYTTSMVENIMNTIKLRDGQDNSTIIIIKVQ